MAHAGGVSVFHYQCLLSLIIIKAFPILHLPMLITVNCIISTVKDYVPVDTDSVIHKL
jgi:hypothetical protein